MFNVDKMGERNLPHFVGKECSIIQPRKHGCGFGFVCGVVTRQFLKKWVWVQQDTFINKLLNISLFIFSIYC